MKDYKKESKWSTNKVSESKTDTMAADSNASKLIPLTPQIKIVTTSFEDFENLEKNIKHSSKGNTLDSLINSHHKSQNESSAQNSRKNSQINVLENEEKERDQFKHEHKVSELDLKNQEFMSKAIF